MPRLCCCITELKRGNVQRVSQRPDSASARKLKVV